jgi:hypothetical protein
MAVLTQLALAWPREVDGQTACGAALAAVPRLVSDTSRGSFELIYPLQVQLDEITWKGALDRVSVQRRVVGHDDVSGIGDALRLAIAQDTAARYQVAEVLARIMRGELNGFASGQAVVASDLYQAWGLPFEPAGVLLSDAKESMAVRALAVFALERYWGDERYQIAARAAVCSLVARAAGVHGTLPRSTRAEVGQVLNGDELELLEWLTRSLDGRIDRARWMKLGFETALTSDNAVIIDLRRNLGLVAPER